MSLELKWRYVLATFLIVVAVLLAFVSFFYAAVETTYEINFGGVAKLKGSSLSLASIVIFTATSLLLTRTNKKVDRMVDIASKGKTKKKRIKRGPPNIGVGGPRLEEWTVIEEPDLEGVPPEQLRTFT